MANITHDSGNTGPYKWKGGGGVFQVTGTFDGATIKLQWSNDSGTTWVDYPSGSLTADGFVPFNLGETTEIRFNTAGGSGSVNVIATADVADGAVNFSASGIASETTVSTISTDIAELVDLSFGQDGVTVLKAGTTTKTVNFRGIQVLTDMAVVTITGSNIGTDLDGVTLPVGYHPVSGTAIDVTANAGLAYLITEA